MFCEHVGFSVSGRIYWPYSDELASVRRTLQSFKRDIQLANDGEEPVSYALYS